MDWENTQTIECKDMKNITIFQKTPTRVEIDNYIKQNGNYFYFTKKKKKPPYFLEFKHTSWADGRPCVLTVSSIVGLK